MLLLYERQAGRLLSGIDEGEAGDSGRSRIDTVGLRWAQAEEVHAIISLNRLEDSAEYIPLAHDHTHCHRS